MKRLLENIFTVDNLIKRNNIYKFLQGKFTYVVKKDIEVFFK
jgi:hypothetical protein